MDHWHSLSLGQGEGDDPLLVIANGTAARPVPFLVRPCSYEDQASGKDEGETAGAEKGRSERRGRLDQRGREGSFSTSSL